MTLHRPLFAIVSLFALRAVSACGDDPRPPKTEPTSGGSSGTGNEGGDAGTSHEGGSAGLDNEGGEAGSACVPRTCASSGVVCGVLDDGCGDLVMCDSGCGSAGHGGAGNCVPRTCESEKKDCGTISDGCGAELDCGTCDGGDCGRVVPNVCGCPSADQVFSSPSRTAGRAVSVGFTGTDAEYVELYEVSCESVDDCEAACLDQGGTEAMCAASECLENGEGGSDCLPAPVWGNLQGIQAESEMIDGAATLVVVATPYHDYLLASDFGLQIPPAAQVRGLVVEVRRAGDASVSDDAVRIVKGGVIGSAERAESDEWTDELSWVTYGGEGDLWGERWTPEDLSADDFGVALAVNYEDTAGNARAYVDQVRVTVHYSLDCNE